MTSVLLATCAALPDGGDERVLPELFARRGITAAWARWDDRGVAWEAADLVAIRTTWDYADRLEEFLGWTRKVSDLSRLVNHADIIAWNTDKSYLAELAEWGIPAVPTVVVVDGAELSSALATHREAVIKPAVGVSGIGLRVWRVGQPTPAVDRPVVVQPLVDSVWTRGEVSVFVMGGSAVGQIAKRPAGDEVRVQEEYGGSKVREPLDQETSALAERLVAEVANRFGVAVPYGRVDLLLHEGRWLVSELEITEPGLYVEVDPSIAKAYVDAISSMLGADG